MRITRRQLRRLIAEAYRTEAPFRSPLEQSDAFIARRYPQFTDKIAAVDPNQREAFKSALDPNRPQPDIKLRGIDNPENGLTQRQINDLVDEYFKEYTVHSSGPDIEIAEHVFKRQVGGLSRRAIDTLYPKEGGIPIPDDEAIEEVIRRYEKAISRPKHRELGHIL